MARLGGRHDRVGAIIGLSDNLGYVLPAIIGLESMGIPSPGETALVGGGGPGQPGQARDRAGDPDRCLPRRSSGDNIGYLLGRRYRAHACSWRRGPFLHHRVRAIRYGDGFFKRHGAKAVFLGRWIALVRFATAWLAGINRMPLQRFFFWNALGGITWGDHLRAGRATSAARPPRTCSPRPGSSAWSVMVVMVVASRSSSAGASSG